MTEPHNAGANHSVEVWFQIEKDEDGYPRSKDWEGLLCTCLDSTDQFRVESIPLYVRGVAVNDVVSASVADSGSYYRFDRLISRGGHSTYRLFADNSPDAVVRELEALGCGVETAAGGRLLAIDVPPNVNAQLRAFLFEGRRAKRWDLQEASVAE
jgi:hypothetical protein